jgi:hypothetical protein
MRSSTTRRDVGVVYGRVHRHRSCRTSILVHLLVQDGLQLVIAHVGLVEDHMVVRRTRSTLDGGVRTEVEVVLVGVGLANVSCCGLCELRRNRDSLTTPESTKVPGTGLLLRSPFSGKKRT